VTGTSRAEAVLAAHAGRDAARPGIEIAVAVDRIVLDGAAAHDVVAEHRRYGKSAEFARRCLFVAGAKVPRKHLRIVTRFAAEHALDLPLDPARPGWPAAVAVEEGHVGSDDLVVGARPELGSLGGIGALALKCVPAELARLVERRTLAVCVPETRRVRIDGRLPRWCGPFDLAVHLLESLPEMGASPGLVWQLEGATVADATVPERMLLCAVLAEAGIVSVAPPDDKTAVWLRARRPGRPEKPAAPPTESEPDATVDARRVRLVALDSPWPGTAVDLSSPDSPVVEEVVVAGEIEELRLAAEAMSERRIRPGLALCVLPATRRTLLHAIEEGLAATLVRSGATLLPPGSAPAPVLGHERRLVTRPTGQAELLCGPAVAGASAVGGRVVDPESMRRGQRRSATQL